MLECMCLQNSEWENWDGNKMCNEEHKKLIKYGKEEIKYGMRTKKVTNIKRELLNKSRLKHLKIFKHYRKYPVSWRYWHQFEHTPVTVSALLTQGSVCAMKTTESSTSSIKTWKSCGRTRTISFLFYVLAQFFRMSPSSHFTVWLCLLKSMGMKRSSKIRRFSLNALLNLFSCSMFS